MPAKMTDFQLAFWRELLAPFPDRELSITPKAGGLTYVDSRALFNRLDSVVGPHGWDIEYRETKRGYTARVGIMVPTGDAGTFVWHYKEDGGGTEDMGSTDKKTGEWESDTDNDEKSAYTNAARRTIQNAWGIGRYLYRKGIPTFLDPNARPFGAPPVTPAPAPVEPERTTRDHTPPPQAQEPLKPPPQERVPPQPAPAPNAAPPASSYGQQPATGAQAPKAYDNFKIPRAGKSIWPWTKEMEKTFQTKLVDGLQREGEGRGWGTTFAEWTQPQVDELIMGCISYIRQLPTYSGQFDHLFRDGQQASASTPASVPGVNVADLRKTLMGKMQELVHLQIGAEPDSTQLKSAFRNICPLVANSEGKLGLVAESLSSLSDVTWIRNMISLVTEQIARAESSGNSETPSDDIPF